MRPWLGWTLSASCVLLVAGAFILLDAWGHASRAAVTPTVAPVHLTRDGAQVYGIWANSGQRGRRVVHAGRFLHFVVPPEASAQAVALLDRPGSTPRLLRAFAGRVDHQNYLWVAAETGVARRVDYLSPPAALRARLEALGRPASAAEAEISFEGFPRSMGLRAPRTDEPVLLDISASWFDESDEAALVAALRAAKLRAAVVTLCLSEGAPDVSEAARARLQELARGWSTLGAVR